MKKNVKQPTVLEKILQDKKAISECIRQGGDLQKLAKERNVKFAKPLQSI